MSIDLLDASIEVKKEDTFNWAKSCLKYSFPQWQPYCLRVHLSPLRVSIVSLFHHIPHLVSKMIGTMRLGRVFWHADVTDGVLWWAEMCGPWVAQLRWKQISAKSKGGWEGDKTGVMIAMVCRSSATYRRSHYLNIMNIMELSEFEDICLGLCGTIHRDLMGKYWSCGESL